MINLLDTQGQVSEWDEIQAKDLLGEGYSFADQNVPIQVNPESPEDTKTPTQYLYVNPSVAKEYILAGRASLLSSKEAREREEEGKYGSPAYIPAAMSIGAINALTFGAGEHIFDRMGVHAGAITRQHPTATLLTDLATFGLAAAAAGPAGPLVAAKGAGKFLTKLGVKNLERASKIAKFTAPGSATLFAKKAERKIAEKFLKKAAIETLEKGASRGLVSRMGSMGLEGAIFAGGYGGVEAVANLYDQRKEGTWTPGEVATSYMGEIGAGALIGMAIPPVFHSLFMGGAWGTKLGKGAIKKGYTAGMNSKVAKVYYSMIAKKANARAMGTLTGPMKAFRDEEHLADSLRLAHMADKSRDVQAKLVANQDSYIDQMDDLLVGAANVDSVVKGHDQAGHSLEFIIDTLAEEVTNKDRGQFNAGVASTATLLNTLFNGTAHYKDVGKRGGLFQELENAIHKYASEASGRTIPKGKQKQGALLLGREQPELNRMLDMVNEMKEEALKTARASIKAVLRSTDPSHEGIKKELNRLGGEVLFATKVGDNTFMRKAIAVLARENSPVEHLLQTRFNARTFSGLEQLSSEVHEQIRKGAFPDVQYSQEWMNIMKQDLTDFLTNAGGWEIDAAVYSTPFGAMSREKSATNTLFKNRADLFEIIKKEFFTPDPNMPVNLIPNQAKIQKFVLNLNHRTQQHQLDKVESFAKYNRETLERLKKAYRVRPTKGRVPKRGDVTKDDKPGDMFATIGWLKGELIKAKSLEDSTNRFTKFLKEEMTPALDYAAILQRESNLADSALLPGLLPYGAALGLGLGTGSIPLALVAAAGVRGFKTAGDMVQAPGRSLSRLKGFFDTANVYDEFMDHQISRYFRWVNHVKAFPAKAGAGKAPASLSAADKKRWDHARATGSAYTGPKEKLFEKYKLTPRGERLEYIGPGSDIKYSKLYTSNAIARLLTEVIGEDTEIYDEPGRSANADAFANARVISEKLSDPNLRKLVLTEATSDISAIDPNLGQSTYEALERTLDEEARAINSVPKTPESLLDAPRSKYNHVSDMHLEKWAQADSIIEFGDGAIIRDIFDGSLTQYKWDIFRRTYPEKSLKVIGKFTEQVSTPGFLVGLSSSEKRIFSIILGVDMVNPSVARHLYKSYEEKEKPGPSPSAKGPSRNEIMKMYSPPTRATESRIGV